MDGENVKYVSSYFSPNRGSADVLIGFIDKCTVSIDAAVYSITHDGIAEALIRAKSRGVAVRIITDKTQSASRWSDDELLEAANIPVLRLGRAWRGSMHNKFIIGDDTAVGTGSFNWTKNADQNNSENFVIVRISYVVKEFKKEFKKLWNEG